MILHESVVIELDHIKSGLKLELFARQSNSLFDLKDEALNSNEARYQLVEGCFYDFSLTDDKYFLGNIEGNIIQAHRKHKHTGSIVPNIYVGTLSIPLYAVNNANPLHNIKLEVQSFKSSYREDYRDMLEYITEKCTDLLLHANSPVTQNLEIDYEKNPSTHYQTFAFINSVLNTEEFAEAINRIVKSPVTRWKELTQLKDIRNAKRFSNSNIKLIMSGGSRTLLPDNHYLNKYGINSLPEKIYVTNKTDSVDTPENRFVKHSLETFLKFCTEINDASLSKSKLDRESLNLITVLESHLNHPIFREVSRPTTLKMNSPILQRKEGYREVLRIWLIFDLAAKLIWTGGEDVYAGGKKDVATLYEYWLFFKLLDLFQSIFNIEPDQISNLIQETSDGLNLQIKQGTYTALIGVFDAGTRKLNVKFNYNRSFSGNSAYPNSGSWTTTLRPDYTLSLWPFGITDDEAEKQELIVHIHFDAKYKVANLYNLIDQNSEKELDDEKLDNRKGIYKNADLLKMHAYKDAIRRTGGAYVLYPGDKHIKQKGFHEIIPGLGAFPVRPSKIDDGTTELKAFILEIVDHFIDRSSQREKQAFRTYDIFKNPRDQNDRVDEPLPEPFNLNRSLIPDDTFVLVGFYKSDSHYDWINKNGLYNFRFNSERGSLKIDNESINAKYLLLHTHNDQTSGELYSIISDGFEFYTKEKLLETQYPNPGQPQYLIVKIERVTDVEFNNVSFDFKKLKNYKSNFKSAFPFTASLTELMKCSKTIIKH